MKTWVVFLVCLNATACFHSVDGTKVKCTTSDHCPTNFVCAGGKCVDRSTVVADGSPSGEAGASTDAKPGVDVTEARTEVGSDVSTATPDAMPNATSDGLPTGLDSADTTDVPLPGTGGVGGAGGVTGAGGIIGSGGGVSSGGASGSGGVLGTGGITTSGGVVGSGGTVTTGGVVGTGGIKGTGGATTSVNYCSSTPCVHGACTSQASGYSCTCTTGWQGTNCDQQIDYCASNPCVHGTCTNSTSGYSCTCAAGWQGTNCDQQINYCASSPCVHGTCSNGTTGYTCSCAAGWNGGICSSAIKPTVSGPADVTMCSGGATDTATFTVAASGGAGGPYSYQWYQASDLNNSNPTAQGGTSSSMQIGIGGRIPMSPGKYYYYVVVTDATNGGTSQSRTATLWIPNPPYYYIPHWGIASSDLWVEIDAPASGCIYYSYSADNSSFTSYQTVCAGTGVQKIDVGTPDYTYPNNNVVRTLNMEGASGYACETMNTWFWDGASQ